MSEQVVPSAVVGVVKFLTNENGKTAEILSIVRWWNFLKDPGV
jgi:hypothetical protein